MIITSINIYNKLFILILACTSNNFSKLKKKFRINTMLIKEEKKIVVKEEKDVIKHEEKIVIKEEVIVIEDEVGD